MIPAAHAWLFWDADPAALDLRRDRDYILERVMSRGDWAAMKWLVRSYPAEDRREFLDRRGARLAPRELAFWSLVSDRRVDPEPGGGRPRWASPR